jgi:hypothetical protein
MGEAGIGFTQRRIAAIGGEMSHEDVIDAILVIVGLIAVFGGGALVVYLVLVAVCAIALVELFA